MKTTTRLFLFFFKTGLLVFGSGLVIVPFLKTQVVDQYHWLGNRQFLDAVAIGMISPGPVVITATFVGYLLNGVIGALAATIGIFAPPVLFTVLATPIILRHYKQPRVAGFIRGVGVTVVGVLVGTTYLVAKEAISDWLTTAIAIGSLAIITIWKKLPDPFVVLAGGIIGLFCYHPAVKQSVVFLCPHGGAKSLIAASYFNRTAEAEHLPYIASAAAAEKPYAAVPAKIANLLEGEGFHVRTFRPRHFDGAGLANAKKVIAIGCDVTPPGVRVERWDDVPMVDDDLPGSAAAIRAHVATLVQQLERGGR